MLIAAAALACLSAYVMLLPYGRWQEDEYTLAANLRQWGWYAIWPRLHYSPRPFSEAVLLLYGEAVLATNRPLIGSFLFLLWGSVLGTGWIAARACLPATLPGRTLWALALSAALLAFFMLSEPLTELFFWPMSAAAYLPTLAAILALVFLLAPRPSPIAAGMALLIAAMSSEVGAAFALFFAALSGLAWLSKRLVPLWHGLWWILPGLAGLAVFAVLGQVRLRVTELDSTAAVYTGQLAASLAAATMQLVREATFGGAFGLADGGGLGQGWAWSGAAPAMRLFLVVSLAGAWHAVDRRGGTLTRYRAILAVALILTAWFSLAAAYYHYGSLCCERQEALRGCLFDLAALLLVGLPLASTAARAWTRTHPGRLRFGAPLLLTAVLAAGLLCHAGALRNSYGLLRFAVEGRSRTWQSGKAPGAAMAFFVPPDNVDMLVHGNGGPATQTPSFVAEMERFFGKERLMACQPWESDRTCTASSTRAR